MKKTNTTFVNKIKEIFEQKIKSEQLNPPGSLKDINKNINLTKDFEKLNPSDWIKSLKENIYQKIDISNFNPGSGIELLQDKIEQMVSSDKNRVVLNQSRFWARAITWVLMGGTAFAIGWISIAETDEVVIAVGKLAPKGGVVDVQMPMQGVAREILIQEGDQVKKGQVLIRLDTEITEAENTALQKTLELNQTISERFSYLVKEGAVSEIQYLEQKARLEDIKSQIKANAVRLRYQEITSPIDGIVFELQPKGPGYVAQTSQPVLKIVPQNNLIAKVEIESRKIGFVRTGKRADISIDSFPASDFGVIEGTVSRIGSDALLPVPAQGKGYRFPADITLNNQYLELKSGKKLPLQTGMSLNANIKLRKLTYLKLLLNKFGDKTKSLKSI